METAPKRNLTTAPNHCTKNRNEKTKTETEKRKLDRNWNQKKNKQTLRANEDVNTVVRNELSPPIVGANVIRILPHSNHLRTVCLRFELLGCAYDGE